jgi:uncharacterized membrane protein (UPF0127 family)
MKKSLFLLIACAVLLFADSRFVTIYVQNKPFRAEIADTPEKQIRGLMFRRCIKDDYGMLFIFSEEDIRSFWMKNTLLSLKSLKPRVILQARRIPPRSCSRK